MSEPQASSAQTPLRPSTAGCPSAQRWGLVQQGRLFLGYLLLATQKKVTRPQGETGATPATTERKREKRNLTTSKTLKWMRSRITANGRSTAVQKKRNDRQTPTFFTRYHATGPKEYGRATEIELNELLKGFVVRPARAGVPRQLPKGFHRHEVPPAPVKAASGNAGI